MLVLLILSGPICLALIALFQSLKGNQKENVSSLVLFYKAKGDAAFMSKHYGSALSYYHDAMTAEGSELKLYEEKAKCYEELGYFLDAVDEYNKAITMCSWKYSLYFSRAGVKYQVGDETAIDDLNTAIKLAKKNGDTQAAALYEGLTFLYKYGDERLRKKQRSDAEVKGRYCVE